MFERSNHGLSTVYLISFLLILVYFVPFVCPFLEEMEATKLSLYI